MGFEGMLHHFDCEDLMSGMQVLLQLDHRASMLKKKKGVGVGGEFDQRFLF